MSTPPVEKPTRDRGNGGTVSEVARQKLIESRLTPNAISLTGFLLCAVAGALVALVAAATARAMAGWRPHAWAFRPVSAPASP